MDSEGYKNEWDSLPVSFEDVDGETDVPKWDGYDSCIVGMVDPEGPLIYDLDDLVGVAMRDGMNKEEAEEYIDFNIVSAYIGSNTPIYMKKLDVEYDDD